MDRFLKLMPQRRQRGLARYGQTLQTHDGRDAILDAEEEVLDTWIYLQEIRLQELDRSAEIFALQHELGRLEKENEELRARNLELTALEHGGVDNWCGYGFAMELLEKWKAEGP